MAKKIKLLTLNVNGIAEQHKRNLVFAYLKTLNFDIVYLQETHSASNGDSIKWTEEWGGRAVWNHGSHRSRGAAVLFNPRLQINIEELNMDNEGRIVALKTRIEEKELNIVNIYAPTVPVERKRFFQELWKYLTGVDNIILGGDFNCIPDPKVDKIGGDPNSGTVGMAELQTLTSLLQITDIWRDKNPSQQTFTWHNRNYNQQSRLDRWYVPQKNAETTSVYVHACPFSDHSAVELQLQPLDERRTGPGVWKLNTSLLQDEYFTHEIRSFLRSWRTQRPKYNNMADWWDAGKIKIKSIAVKHSVRKAKSAKKKEKELLSQLSKLTQKPKPDVQAIDKLKDEIRQLTDKRLQGARIRSRAAWAEKGEKSTGFFFSLERKKQPRNTITELTTATGQVKTDLDILAETQKYYQVLFNDEPTNAEDQVWLINQLDTKLTQTTKTSCEGPLTEKECSEAIKKMAKNKSPGPDGLPAEFFQVFWNDLGEDLVTVFNENYDSGEMTPSQREAILRLLFKKNNKKLLKNWRPISLLNADYKIAAKALATRLKRALPEIINPDQTCGVPNRTIFENIFRLRDLIATSTKNNTDLILINLDQEKAFDRVNRDFLRKVFLKLNFGPSFRRWIDVLYAGAFCRIMNNGWRTDPVELRRGVRQGCPLSPLLYAIVIESFGNVIRKNQRIRGFGIPGTPTPSKIVQYADDCTLTLKDDSSVLHSFDVLSRFEAASGSKLNMEKTEGIYIGPQAGRTHGPVPIDWHTENIEVLGVKLGNNNRQDWEKRVEKAENKLGKWKKRDLSITGRALLIRTYALASIIYLATVFAIPGAIITKINTMMFSFLWKDKNELVKRSTMHLPLHKGGLAIPELKETQASLNFKWLQQITDSGYDRPWVHFARYWMGIQLSTIRADWSFLRTSLKPHADPSNIPVWYKTTVRLAQQHRLKLLNEKGKTITAKTLRNLTANDKERPRAEKIWKCLLKLKKKEAFETTWKEIWTSLGTNKEKEVQWKLTHRVLTTKAYLAKWGMLTNTNCPFCGSTEDTYHALIGCDRAAILWRKLQDLIRPVQDNLVINLACIVFFEGLPEEKYARELIRYLISATISILWETRNKEIFKTSTRQDDLYEKLKKRVKDRITCDYWNRKITNLELIWQIKGILCTFHEDNLTFNI